MTEATPDWKRLCAELARTLAEFAARYPEDQEMQQLERQLRLIAFHAAND